MTNDESNKEPEKESPKHPVPEYKGPREERHPDYDPFTKTGNYGVWDDFMKTYV